MSSFLTPQDLEIHYDQEHLNGNSTSNGKINIYTVKSRFKKDLKLQIHLHKAFFSDDWFLDSLHKSFLNQTTLNFRKEKWTFLNRNFTVMKMNKFHQNLTWKTRIRVWINVPPVPTVHMFPKYPYFDKKLSFFIATATHLWKEIPSNSQKNRAL